MAQLSLSQFKAQYGTTGTTFPDNTTGAISESDMRQFGEDIADSTIDQMHRYFRVLEVDNTTFGNTGIGPDNLYEYEVPAGTLTTAGDYVSVIMYGSYTNDSTDKDLRLYWGNQQLIELHNATETNIAWSIEATISYLTNTTQKVFARALYSGATQTVSYISGTQNTTSGVDLTLEFELNSSIDDAVSLEFVSITRQKV